MLIPFERMSLRHLAVRASQLDGTYPADVGAWILTSLRAQRLFGIVAEEEWPKIDGEERPYKEPPGMDALAKTWRLQGYFRIRDATECRKYVEAGNPVSIALRLTEQWYEADRGIILLPKSDREVTDSHCVCLSEFDNTLGIFTFTNSWDGEWGDNGIGYLPYDYVERYMFESWYGFDYGPMPGVNFHPKLDDVQTLTHAVEDPMGKMVMLFGLHNAKEDEPIGWSIGVKRDDYFEIEEFFVSPKYRRQGFGRRLAKIVSSIPSVLNLQLKFWIPFADYDVENRSGMERILESLGLALADTSNRWSAYTTVPLAERTHRLKPVLLPPRPKGRHGGSDTAAGNREKALNMANYILDEYAELYERLS